MIGLVIFTVASLLCGVAHQHADAAALPRPAGRRRRDHVRGVAGAAGRRRSAARTAASRSASGARSPASRWRSGRCSAACSPSGLSWRWIFFVNLPIGDRRGGHHVAAGRRVARPARPPAGLGRASCCSASALASLVYGADRVEPDGRSATALVLGCLVAAGVLLVAFVLGRVARAGRRCSTSSCFRQPTFTGGSVAAFGISRLDLRAAALPRALPAGRPRLQRAGAPACGCCPLRRHLRRRGDRRAADRARARCGC